MTMTRFEGLEGLRGLAALSVLNMHLLASLPWFFKTSQTAFGQRLLQYGPLLSCRVEESPGPSSSRDCAT